MGKVEGSDGIFGWRDREVGGEGEVSRGREDRESSAYTVHDGDQVGQSEVSTMAKRVADVAEGGNWSYVEVFRLTDGQSRSRRKMWSALSCN